MARTVIIRVFYELTAIKNVTSFFFFFFFRPFFFEIASSLLFQVLNETPDPSLTRPRPFTNSQCIQYNMFYIYKECSPNLAGYRKKWYYGEVIDSYNINYGYSLYGPGSRLK